MFRRRKDKPSNAAPKEFVPPSDFRSWLEILTRIAAYSFCSEVLVRAYTSDHDGHRKGEISLTLVERNIELRSLLQSGLPDVFRCIYQNPDFRYGVVQQEYPCTTLDFYEPDCYLFTLPKEDFAQWAKKISLRSFVWDYWTISEPMRIRLTCDEIEFKMRMYRHDQFIRYMKKNWIR